MADRIQAFLAEAGWGDAKRAALAGDASNRRYERLNRSGGSTVLMVAPPEKGEDVRPFIAITRHLRRAGLSAPEIFAADEAVGLLLLEDLGDDLFARVLARGAAPERLLYTCATDLLVELHRHAPPADLAAYDSTTMAKLAALALDWYLPGATGAPCPDDHKAVFLGEIETALSFEADRSPVLIQRDYHAENLIWLPQRTGVRRVGLLDYQDAMLGHPAYDLVSLLQDARRDVPTGLQDDMIAHYLTRTGLEETPFRTAYAALGAQRNLRILGVFARLSLHFGKPAYTALIPRVWAHLQADLAHPALGGLRAVLDPLLPPPDADVLQRIKDQCGTIPTL